MNEALNGSAPQARYFYDAARQLLALIVGMKRSPINRRARALSCGEKGMLSLLAWQSEGVTAGHLGRMIGIGSGGVANLLNALEKKGYVERKMSPTDRRSVLVSISESGRAVVAEKQEEVCLCTQELLSRLGREDTEELLRILRRVVTLSDEMQAQACQQEETTTC